MKKVRKKCPHCGKTYICGIIAQRPGYKWREEQICPYCNKIVRTSLEFEFYTEKLEKDEKRTQ